jgi:hypothetical protein
MGIWLIMVTIAIGAQPTSDVTYDKVDLTEINHYYDEHGRLVFDQIIFHDWISKNSEYRVVAWRMLKSDTQIPVRRSKYNDFISTWYDGDLLRKVISKTCMETWTQYDPELEERKIFPKEKRRELSKLKRPIPPMLEIPEVEIELDESFTP